MEHWGDTHAKFLIGNHNVMPYEGHGMTTLNKSDRKRGEHRRVHTDMAARYRQIPSSKYFATLLKILRSTTLRRPRVCNTTQIATVKNYPPPHPRAHLLLDVNVNVQFFLHRRPSSDGSKTSPSLNKSRPYLAFWIPQHPHADTAP